MKLNVGCGTDYREGYINIDGSNALSRVDKVIDISTQSLLPHFNEGEFEFILASDIVEHHFHWEAVRLLKDFHVLLKIGGQVKIKVPDAEGIINNPKFSVERKLKLLFGGQDVPRGDNHQMNESRKKFPHYFCHKYGWTMKLMKKELFDIGFSKVQCKRAGNNFVAMATK